MNTEKDLVSRAYLDAVVRGTLDAVRDVLNELDDRVKRLEQAPPTLKFVGEWMPHTDYAANQIVQHAGSAWCAVAPSRDVRPGTDDFSSMAWRLLVSRGRPGKDAKGRSDVQ